MRTKLVLALAAAAAIAIPASAQVYSANVVGYVNYTLQPNGVFNFIANPLKAADNSIGALFPNATEGDAIMRWDVAANDLDFNIPAYGGGVWTPSFELKPGEGVFYVSAATEPVTVTYVGEVIQGNFTNILQPNGVFNAIGSSAPLGGSLVNSIGGLTPTEGDAIMLWDVAANDLNFNIPSYGGGVWTPEPNIAVGEGFFYVSAATEPVVWVRNFTVAP